MVGRSHIPKQSNFCKTIRAASSRSTLGFAPLGAGAD